MPKARVGFLRELARRLTGFSTPFFGLTWQATSGAPGSGQHNADVRVSLVGSSRDARFLIKNVGGGIAHGVHFDIEQHEGKESPLVKGDFDVKVPIAVLRDGAHVELLAALTFGTGVVFDAKWWWRDDDGSLRERAEKVSLQKY